jgi:aldose 1-epimerase
MKNPAILLALMTPFAMLAQYRATQETVDGIEVYRLIDGTTHTEVAIAPSIGNIAFEMKVNGKNVFWFPYETVGQLKAKPVLCGNPFLAPWANRLDQDAMWINGKKYALDPDLGNLRRDGNKKPIHGLLAFSNLWRVPGGAETTADSVQLRSVLEFWKYPDLMQQFPFAHSIHMTYRLSKGVLEVKTEIQNLSSAKMPVSIGYHPYFRVHDAPRDEWKVRLAARDRYTLSPQLIPTGETKPHGLPEAVPLGGTQLDDVFGGLVRGSDGKAHFSVEGKREKVTVSYGPKFPIAVVYAPKGREFICFEPMAAITNAINLAHEGLYKDLPLVEPGQTWSESFWITPSGF